MKINMRFQIRGVQGFVNSADFNGRRVDFWAPEATTGHLLIAHDGQNVFDPRTATRRRTWHMAESAIRVSEKLGIIPPAIIGVFHSGSNENPYGRIYDLTPEDPFKAGIKNPDPSFSHLDVKDLYGNKYLSSITDEIAPKICNFLELDIAALNKAIIGASMGGLASLYGIARRPDFFTTCLALSTHWSCGEMPLVDAMIDALPKPANHKIWMSHGTKGIDSHYGPFQKYADQKMLKTGWRIGRDFQTHVYPRSRHNERSWAKYLDQPMNFWLQS